MVTSKDENGLCVLTAIRNSGRYVGGFILQQLQSVFSPTLLYCISCAPSRFSKPHVTSFGHNGIIVPFEKQTIYVRDAVDATRNPSANIEHPHPENYVSSDFSALVDSMSRRMIKNVCFAPRRRRQKGKFVFVPR